MKIGKVLLRFLTGIILTVPGIIYLLLLLLIFSLKSISFLFILPLRLKESFYMHRVFSKHHGRYVVFKSIISGLFEDEMEGDRVYEFFTKIQDLPNID
jgi:uncharacterized membrane protein